MDLKPGDSFSFEVSFEENGERLDIILSEKFFSLSRSFGSSLIKSGAVRVDGEIKKPGYRIRYGETVTGLFPLPKEYSCIPQEIHFDCLYEDSDLIVVDKPAGLVVHPAPGHETGTLVNALLSRCPDLEGIGGELRPGIVHRLDKNTSGLIVVAKNQASHIKLTEMFKLRQISKKYIAIVVGVPALDDGMINHPIGRHSVDRKRMSVNSSSSTRDALTFWTVLERLGCASLIEADIKTGRTHQIRVHMESIGHPIVGDDVYGLKLNSALRRSIGASFYPTRQMLHAWKLSFNHPSTGQKLEFTSPLPGDFTEFLNFIRIRRDSTL